MFFLPQRIRKITSFCAHCYVFHSNDSLSSESMDSPGSFCHSSMMRCPFGDQKLISGVQDMFFPVEDLHIFPGNTENIFIELMDIFF